MSEQIDNHVAEAEERPGREFKPAKPQHHGDHQDWLSAVTWAVILIWAGVAWLGNNLGWLDAIKSQLVDTNFLMSFNFLNLPVWTVVVLGAGIIVLIEAIIRLIVPALRKKLNGALWGSAILLGIGLSNIFGWDRVWPIFLIVLGLVALGSAFLRKSS